jgi:hypothetical protein
MWLGTNAGWLGTSAASPQRSVFRRPAVLEPGRAGVRLPLNYAFPSEWPVTVPAQSVLGIVKDLIHVGLVPISIIVQLPTVVPIPPT